MKPQVLSIVSALGCLTLASPAALVAHYKFDEAPGATSAANSVGESLSPGAVGSLVVTGVTGISGNAYQFPNNATQAGIVDMGNAAFFANITTAGELTFSVWVKTTDIDGGRNVVVFAGSDSVANRYIDMGLVGGTSPNPGSVNGRLRPTAATGDITEVFSTPTLVNDDQWHHLVLTISIPQDVMTLYIDGELASSSQLVSETFPAFNNFEIGRLGRQGTTVDPFGGLVDDVQVYNQALNPTQVRYLFDNPGMAVPEPGAAALGAFGLLLAAARRRRA